MRKNSGYFLQLAAIVYFLSFEMLATASAQQVEQYEGFAEVEVSQVDYFDVQIEEKRYDLILSDGTRAEMFYGGQPEQEFRTGDYVYVNGDVIREDGFDDAFLISDDPDSQPMMVAAMEADVFAAAVTGVRDVLVLRVEFNDGVPGCSENSINGLMYSNGQNVDQWFDEVSFNQLSLNDDFDGDTNPDTETVSINANLADACSATTWANLADAATAFTPSNYDHVVYVLPNNITCGWAGLGNLGGGGTRRTWVKGNYCNLADVYAHEIGHNIGLYHSGLAGGVGNDAAYGDTSCVMGYGGIGYRHFHAPHKSQMGWIPAGRIQTITTSGTYQVALTEKEPASAAPVPPTSIQMLKIARSQSPGDAYFLSFRVQTGGYSTQLLASYRNEVHVHDAAENYLGTSLLEATLANGQSFNDATENLTVTVTAVDTNHATVSVTIGSGGGGGGDAGGGGGDDDDDDDLGSGSSISGYLMNKRETRLYTRRLAKKIRRGLAVKIINRDTREATIVTPSTEDASFSLGDLAAGSYLVKLKKGRLRSRLCASRSSITADGSSDYTTNIRIWRKIDGRCR